MSFRTKSGRTIFAIALRRLEGDAYDFKFDEKALINGLGLSILRALSAMHVASIIHYDIKPANILVDSTPVMRYVLADFGLSTMFDEAEDDIRRGRVFGTIGFRSPLMPLGGVEMESVCTTCASVAQRVGRKTKFAKVVRSMKARRARGNVAEQLDLHALALTILNIADASSVTTPRLLKLVDKLLSIESGYALTTADDAIKYITNLLW
jgi:serine/threonine protein kinase